MSRACSTCGSSDIDFDPSRGDTVCTNCGSVLEESVIVSEVTFQDNSAGGSSVIGQFVSNEGNKVGQGLGFRSGFGRESRTVTLENGKRRLQALASQLQLNNHCVESAYMFLKLAVSKRLTKGRRTNHVAAACLYLVCRTEKTPHLLIDFSDLLQVDVMVLGKIFLKLQHELCINLPVIDPCLYIHRFSHQLQLEDKEQEVTNTALRLVSRMKRDWLQYGRRPSGLCGAALLVAARLHGFRRTVKEIVKVVRLSVTTVRKRLSEFKKTPSGQLTVDQFNNIDLEEEQDPPSFTLGRQRLKQQQLDEFNAINKPALAKELEDLRREIEKVLDKTKTKTLETGKLDTAAPPEAKTTNEENFGNSLNNEVAEVSNESVCDNEPASNLSTDNTETTVSDKPCEENIVTDKDVGEVDDNREKEDNGNLEEEVTNENCNGKISEDKEILNTTNEDDEVKGGNDEAQSTQDAKDIVDGLDDLDDDELDGLILTAPEVEVKTKVWMEENKDYLEKLKEKEEREAKEREDGDQNKKKRRKPYKKRTKEQANSVGEAVEKMLIEKKISNKINYDVLRNLNRENELEKPSKQEELESTTSAPVSSLLQAVQTSIPIRYKGRKRDKNILPHLPTKRVKFSDSVTEQEVPGDAGTNAVPSVHAESNNVTAEESVLVESGPVEYDDHDQECMDDEDDEDVHLSAAQLMGQYGQGDLEEFGDFDAY